LDFVIIFPKTPIDRFKFIITANGNLENFKQVIDMVDNAPLLKDWKFTAFINAKEAIAGK
jgi:hypothetical protein